MKIRTITLFTLLPGLLLAVLYLRFAVKDTHAETGEDGMREYTYLLKKVSGFQYQGSMIDCWQYYNGRLYVGDQADQVIYVLENSGAVIDTLGEAGSAPWQNQQLRRFSIDESGIYSADNSLMTLKLMKEDNQPVFYSKLPEPFWDGVHLDESRFLLVNDQPEKFGFTIWDAKTSKYLSNMRFDSVMNLGYVPNIHIAYEGEMTMGERAAAYVCSRAGRFFIFDKAGRLRGTYQTIDKTPAPKITERRINNMVMFERQPDEIVNYAADMDGEFLYVLSTIAFQASDEMTIDAYGLDGRYSFSMYVPNHHDNFPVSIHIHGDYIWILYEDLFIQQFEMINVPA